MFDAKRLLDQFMSDPQSRVVLDQFTGGGRGPDKPRSGSDRWDLPVLGDVEKSSFTKGALSGGLAGLVLGKKSKTSKGGGSAMQMGGLALIGTLAYKAYQTWQQSQAPSTVATARQPAALPPPDKTPFLPMSPEGQQSGDALVLGGPSRLVFHGVDRLMARTSTLLPEGGRINLTLRRVTRPA